jgi:hypothetical protein
MNDFRPPQQAPFAGPPPAGYGMGNQGYRMPAPSNVPESERPSRGIVSFHLISAVAPAVGFIAGGIMMAVSLGTIDQPGDAPGAGFFVGVSLLCLAFIGIMVCSILKMVWFYQIWSWIPPSHRVTKTWSGGMSPAFAALGHLIPYFSIYWAFAAAFATCDAMETLSAQYTPGRPSPRNMAMAMAICSLLFFPAAPFLMHIFMRDIGRMAEQIDVERTRVGGLAI